LIIDHTKFKSEARKVRKIVLSFYSHVLEQIK
jgi:hypothetical protein